MASMRLPWYGWVGLAGGGAFITLGFTSALAWRKRLVDDLIAYLDAHLPEWRVERRSSSKLVLRNGEGDAAEFSLFNLRAAASQIRGDAATQAAAREELFATSIAAFEEQVALLDGGSGTTELLARIFPRLATKDFLSRLPSSATMPQRALGDTTLSVVYVVDSPHAVAYVDEQRMHSLGASESDLYELALANLRAIWPIEATREALESRTIVVSKALDTYDAARLLLVPERLVDGEELAVLIPDRDTLVLAPVPANGDWNTLNRLASKNAGRELLPRALRVSRDGIRVA